MRILHLTPRYLPAVGGAERHLAAISEHLAGQGHAVTVATTDAADIEAFWDPSAGRLEGQREVINEVQVVRFAMRHLPGAPGTYHAVRRLIWLLSHLRAPVPLLQRLARLTPAVPDLRRWLATTTEPFDLVAAMNIGYETFIEAADRFCRQRRLPLVVYPLTHLGAGPAPGRDRLSRFYTLRHQVRSVLAAQAIITQSPAEKAYYLARGAADSALSIIGPGVWPAELVGGDAARGRRRFHLPEAGALILSLGTLSVDKGTGQLLRAFARVRAVHPQAFLALAGAPAEDIREALGAAGDRVHLLGRIGHEEKLDLLAAADLLVMTSRVDSFGLVYLEAWAYGKPVIAAQSWGVADLVEDGVDGRLVPFEDDKALAAVIEELLARPAERERLGRRGREKMERHIWPAKLDQIEAIYHSLAKS